MPSIKPPHEKPKFGHITQQTPPAKPLMLQPKCEYQNTLKHHSNHAISIPETPVNNPRNNPPINIYQPPLLKLIIAVCPITTTSTTAVNKERISKLTRGKAYINLCHWLTMNIMASSISRQDQFTHKRVSPFFSDIDACHLVHVPQNMLMLGYMQRHLFS